jgi:hypothetical protein
MAAALDLPAAYFFASDERLARLISAFHHLGATEKDKLLKVAEKASGICP